jgi:hypothetical protein
MMARVTMELRNVLKIEEFELFDFDYPIEDVTWKDELEAAIIDYFFFHEIGQETIDRFKQRFSTRLKLIMPYYNELFRSQMMVVDPLLTHALEETLEDDSSINSTVNSASGAVYTEYPEHTTMVDNIPSNRSEGNSTNTQGTTTSHDYKKVIQGMSGVNINELLSSYRKNIININQLIINDMKQCFVMIY